MKKYFIRDGSETIGPFDAEDLKQRYITKETLLWMESIGSWSKAGDIAELNHVFDGTSPIIDSDVFVKSKKPFNGTKILVLLGITIFTGAVGYFLYNYFNKESSLQSTETKNNTSTSNNGSGVSDPDQRSTNESGSGKTSTATGSNQITFVNYSPCTFGITLPSNLKLNSMNTDSNKDRCDYSVITEDGFEIMQLHSLLSSRFVTNSIVELYNSALGDKEIDVTYKVQKDNWFVISGYSKNGNIVYWKRISGSSFVSDMRIEYPKSRASQIEPNISKIETSFTSQ